MSDDDKPFACTTHGCGMRFTNEDHLMVHMKKHDMSLALNTGSSLSPNNLFLDQTPTPTKFLRNCEEIGLFQELIKNPFEEAFKKASDVDSSDGAIILHNNKDAHSPVPNSNSPSEGNNGVPLPGPHSNSNLLDTPSIATKTPSQLEKAVPHTTTQHEEKVKQNISPAQSTTQSNQPSSTTSEDDVIIISKTQPADSSTPTTQTAALPMESNSPVIISMESQSVIRPSSVVDSSSGLSSPQYTMQVLLQLPTGQTVPVHIPASLSTQPVQVTHIPVNQSTPPLLSKSTTSSPVPPTPTQPSLAKQKLKAVLQQSAQQNHTKVISSSTLGQTVSPPSTATVGGNVKTLLTSDVFNIQVASSATATSTSSTLNNSLEDSNDSSFLDMDSMVGSPDSLDSVSLGSMKRKREDGDPEDRRRKFLERNRAAAARCRQRRKQWITNLEKKADELQNTNNRLQSEVNSLRNEVAQLKTLLLAHKDCPITLQQKSQGQLSIQTIRMPVVDGMLLDTGDVATAEAIATSALTNMATVIVDAETAEDGIEIITQSPDIQVKKET